MLTHNEVQIISSNGTDVCVLTICGQAHLLPEVLWVTLVDEITSPIFLKKSSGSPFETLNSSSQPLPHLGYSLAG